MSQKLPKILSNIPEGKDLFKAESHRKISNSIISIIENQSDLIDKQIIGLEGDWGTGKSNIIKIIEDEMSNRNELKDKYVHFTFDTWTHQEDLTRKSIIIELINSLRNTIESFKSDKWMDEEAQLSQKRISKNIKHFPQIKLYYVFLVIGFIIIKFINETKKQIIDGKLYGYYDNSLSYLKTEFCINFSNNFNATYLYKLVPYLFFIISVILFFISFYNDYILNKNKDKKDKNKLNFWGLVGKSFYWISGEKLETNSDETITETEPSNLRFRNFLNDIDGELISNNKTLILTIDNTDRLTSEKLKSIWSTINIFFAENNNSVFLKNIWLIIPHDSRKVITSFKEENIGIGLLEKTFAVTFKVPPPLISNWELFFKICFEKAFDNIDLKEKDYEIEILLRVYENYENEITPRRIINFINQLSTYYIQNPIIKLRYFSIVVLKKEVLFDGMINENIINRSKYLEKLDTLFTEDTNLELNLAKVIYGVDKDSDAQESLLHNVIEDRLQNNKEFDVEILSLPYFYTYFHKYFKKFIDNTGSEDRTNYAYFDEVTTILNHLESFFIKENKKSIYNDLWEYYYKRIAKNRFTIFNETVIGVCKNCSKKARIGLINKSLFIMTQPASNITEGLSKEDQIIYINFLKDLNSFIAYNKIFNFKDLIVREQDILAEVAIGLIREDRELYKNSKLKTSIKNLKLFLNENPFDDNLYSSKLIEFKNELSFLNQEENLYFIEEDINTKWINRPLINSDEIEALIFYHTIFNNINIDKVSDLTFSSIINLIINADKNVDLTNAFLLIFINYNKAKTKSIKDEISDALERFDNYTYQNMIKRIKEYSIYQKSYKVFDLCIKFNENQNLKEFSLNLLKTSAFKLHDDSFNWILENYTILNSKVFNLYDFDLYDLLNRNAKNHKIIIENIDVELIIKSSKFLNTELIDKANNYLLNNIKSNKAFLQNTTNVEYKLFKKLLNLDKINKEFFNDNFIHSFKSLIINNNLPIQISNQLLIKIKSFIDEEKLKLIISSNLNRLNGKNKIYILSPEIFLFFDKIQIVNKNKILQSILEHEDFYNEQFINQVIVSQNVNLMNAMKKRLAIHHNDQIKEMAIKKGIIEINT